ncbi:hypothetical protein [Sphingomonas hengshuiensis]|uniref:Uncharacterized protein n=1 Tax=Sphingomonas hengshuiensis TaxID=1609977 RepID=A0A7U5BE85_9SPHN|nr:hypothetical protein [Sphingomonas hengshuiensis]AJP70644.1 hypothetical protein TS85_00545 [Sphingomonas hengshuiensis]
MIGKAIAGWVGSKVDQRDGEGGTVGAIVGVVVWEVGKRVVPAAIVLGAAAYGVRYVSQRMARA